MYTNASSKKFFEMLRSFTGLITVGEFNHRYGEIRTKDLTFIDENDLEGDGFIYLTKTKDEKGGGTSYYQRVYRTGDTITFCDPTDGEATGTYPIEDVEIKGKVTGIYRPLPAVPMVDVGKHSRLFESIHNVKCPERYDMKWGEMEAVRAKNKGGALSCIMDAFLYGFLKGQRSEKARIKKIRQNLNSSEDCAK